MNEKIRQLAKQAGLADEVNDGSRNAELEEFARLVIQEYRRELKESRREIKSNLGYSRVGLKNI